MAYKQSLFRIACLCGVAVTAIIVFTAVRDRMWANLVFGLAGFVASAIPLLVGRDVRGVSEPGAGEIRVPRAPQPVAALLDQVPIPLLKSVEGDGLHALNLAARQLFGVDDFVSEPPPALVSAIAHAERGMRPSIELFDNVYALSISEFRFEGRTEKFISLTNIQAELRIAEAAALGDTLRVISHEIMNSLTPVASLADTAQTYLADDTPGGVQSAREAIDLLAKRANGLKRFVEGYRTLARLPKPVLRHVDLKGFVEDVVRVFEQSALARDVAISLRIDNGAIVVDMDEALMAQAMINVLTNAAEATQGNTGPRRIGLALTHMEHDIGIAISDNGGGVDVALRERIFHGFMTTKPEGAGVGLSLARQIALAHGGDLRLTEPGDGWSSEFLFRLPVSAPLTRH